MLARGTIIKSTPPFKWLRAAFDCLGEVINDYVRWEEEPPYWNNEAATVSLLVAAATRAGYIALSDYRTDKNHQRRAVKGRCDLLIDKVVRGRKYCYLEIEAKWIYVRPTTKLETIDKKLCDACRDAKDLRPRNKSHQAGLLFAVLSLAPEEVDQLYQKHLNGFVAKIGGIKSDFSWVWIDNNSKNKNLFMAHEDGRFHPGLAVLLRS